MPNQSTQNLRNVGLVGHHGAGKTTLAEALLAATGAIDRQGSVDKGTTVCDFEPEETARQLSVSLAIAPFEVDGARVNLLDTPGTVDFAAEVATGMSVADLVVLVVSATDGVQAQTIDTWRMAERRGMPRIVVINKLDRERADFDRALASVRDAFGQGVAPVELPIGHEGDFHGVIDLLDDTATHYDLSGATAGSAPPKGVEGPIPDELVDEEHEVHEQLIEGIVVGDDDLMARYLEGEPISRHELEATLAGGVAAGLVFPVLCCSGASGVGIDRLAKLLVELCPPPSAAAPTLVAAGDGTQLIECDPDGPPLLSVCKTISDPHSGKVSLCRVHSGTLGADATLVNPRSKAEERLHGLQTLRGRDGTPVSSAVAGDFVAVPRLTDTVTGDTLAPKNMPVVVVRPELEPSALSVAVRPLSRQDDDKMMSALNRLCDEDLALGVERVDETHQTVLKVAGEIHLGVTIERLARKYHVAVEREDVIVPYHETIAGPAQAEERYKKQTGGHGQFAVVHLRVEPLPRGKGFEFHDEVVGGAIPRQFIPAVERGVREAMEMGGPNGYAVVDVAVTCDDGKHHPVDSSEMSFKTAAGLAFHKAVAEAGPVVLEPIARLDVSVPAESQGDVLGDLHSRRGRVLGTDMNGDGMQLISALVPVAEISRYAIELRAITGGRGRVRTEHDHYDVRP